MGPYWTEDVLEKLERHNPWYRRPRTLPAAGTVGAGGGGVNVCGYLRDESGWGAAGRGYVRALRRLQVPLALCDISSMSSNRAEDTSCNGDSAYPHDVNVVCVDPGQHFAAMARLGQDFFDGHHNIGAWAWELPRFPQKWFDRLAYYDEFWVTTSFVANTLAPVSPVPVVRIPPVLTPAAGGSRERGRRRLGLAAGEFLYLFVFDFHSHMARKNPMAAIDAFRAAFRPSDAARLAVKCVNGDSDPRGLAAMRERAAGWPISIHDGYWAAGEVRDLMAACDAYVSLHRAEGTGLTITDAMALGKPVIATGWSGNMDFMSVANSYAVHYELVELGETVGPYLAGERWAEPSVEHAAELMRRVFERRDEAEARGRAAGRDIAASYSEEAVARLIGARLQVIGHRHQIPAFREDMRAFFAAYQELPGRIREVVGRCVPADATVVVVSKGDDALLKLPVERAWHFPQTADGTYAGHYPATSAAAIAHLEALRARGATHLLLPGTALWWLDHYGGLREHLETRYRRPWSDARCAIYDLAASMTASEREIARVGERRAAGAPVP